MDYVLDATIALKWSFKEVFSDEAKLLLPRLLNGTDQAFAPALLLAEVGHNLRKRRFQKNLPPADIWDSWADFRSVPMTIVPVEVLIGNAFALSNQRMVTTYDALYAQLAIDRAIPVLTTDGGIFDAFAPSGLALHIRDFPFRDK